MKRVLFSLALLIALFLGATGVLAADVNFYIENAGNCTWNITLSGTGFSPGNAMYIDMTSNETACDGTQTNNGFQNWNVGFVDAQGNFAITLAHHGWGTYDYTLHDALGVTQTIQISYSQTSVTCVGSFEVGDEVRVTAGLSNRLRSGPSTSNTVLSMMTAGTQMEIIGGPSCADGYVWWNVRVSDGRVGWTAEGPIGELWLEPVVANQTCTASMRAYFDTERGGYVLEVPLSPLPQSFMLTFDGVVVPDTNSGVRHTGYAGPTGSGLTYLRISQTFRNGHPYWEADNRWLMTYVC